MRLVREVLLTPPPHASPAAGVCAFRFPRICTLHLLLARPAAGSQHALEPPGRKQFQQLCCLIWGPSYGSNEGSPSLWSLKGPFSPPLIYAFPSP